MDDHEHGLGKLFQFSFRLLSTALLLTPDLSQHYSHEQPKSPLFNLVNDHAGLIDRWFWPLAGGWFRDSGSMSASMPG